MLSASLNKTFPSFLKAIIRCLPDYVVTEDTGYNVNDHDMIAFDMEY